MPAVRQLTNEQTGREMLIRCARCSDGFGLVGEREKKSWKRGEAFVNVVQWYRVVVRSDVHAQPSLGQMFLTAFRSAAAAAPERRRNARHTPSPDADCFGSNRNSYRFETKRVHLLYTASIPYFFCRI